MRVRFSAEARAELNEHVAYIRRRSPQGARRGRASVYAAAKCAALFPEAARLADEPSDEPGAVPGTREIILPDYPYIMPYRIEDDALIILHVFHTYLLKKRGPGRQGRRGGVAGGRLKHDAEGLPWN